MTVKTDFVMPDYIDDIEFKDNFGLDMETANIAITDIKNILATASAGASGPERRVTAQLSLLAETIDEICIENKQDPAETMLQIYMITREMKEEGAFGPCL